MESAAPIPFFRINFYFSSWMDPSPPEEDKKSILAVCQPGLNLQVLFSRFAVVPDVFHAAFVTDMGFPHQVNPGRKRQSNFQVMLYKHDGNTAVFINKLYSNSTKTPLCWGRSLPRGLQQKEVF
jgi:hypothetical protein